MQLIERANAWAGELGMGRRVFFEQANATISLDSMLRSYPGSLELCTIQVTPFNVLISLDMTSSCP